MVTFNEPKIDSVIFISDIHFGVKNGSIDWLENMKMYFMDFFIPYVKRIKKTNRPCVVVAGDYFDNRQFVDINVLNTALDIMELIAKECKVYMIIGNHDIYKSNDVDINSLRPLSYIKNVNIVHDIAELVIKNDKKFLLVSWIGDMKKENKIIAENKDKYDILVFHTELSGMSYDNGRKIINGLNIDIVDDMRIVSGHIHKRQESKRGIYLGSPYHTSRMDIGNKKGIYTFFSEDDGLLTISFTGNNISPEFILKRFSEVGRKAEDWKDIVHNNYVYIVFTTSELDVVNVTKFVNELQEYKPKDINIIEEKQVVNVNVDQAVVDGGGEVVDLSVKPDATIEEIFETKLRAFKLTKDQQKVINKMNTDYLTQALS